MANETQNSGKGFESSSPAESQEGDQEVEYEEVLEDHTLHCPCHSLIHTHQNGVQDGGDLSGSRSRSRGTGTSTTQRRSQTLGYSQPVGQNKKLNVRHFALLFHDMRVLSQHFSKIEALRPLLLEIEALSAYFMIIQNEICFPRGSMSTLSSTSSMTPRSSMSPITLRSPRKPMSAMPPRNNQ